MIEPAPLASQLAPDLKCTYAGGVAGGGGGGGDGGGGDGGDGGGGDGDGELHQYGGDEGGGGWTLRGPQSAQSVPIEQ